MRYLSLVWNVGVRKIKKKMEIKKYLITAYLLLVIPSVSSAAIGTSTVSVFNPTGSSFTQAYTVSSVNSALIIGARPYASSGNGDFWTGLSYAGTSMTKLGWFGSGCNPNDSYYLWGVINPSIGSNNIVGTSSVSYDGGFNFFVTEYTGVNSFGATSTAISCNSSGISTRITTQSSNSWVVGTTGSSGGGGSAGSNTMARPTAINPWLIESTSNPIATPSSVSLAWSGASTNPAWDIGINIVSLQPTEEPTASPTRRIKGMGASR